MKSLLPVLLCLLSLPALAAEYNPLSCSRENFPPHNGPLSAARIAGASGPVHFYKEDEDCPGSGGSCQTKAYLVNGDSVLVASPPGEWRCAWYAGKKRDYVGLLPAALLAPVAAQVTPLKAWLGIWRPLQGDNNLRITLTSNHRLKVTGDAFWYGGNTAEGYPNVHTGNVDFVAQPQHNQLKWGNVQQQDSCAGEMTLINGNLVVTDNGACGGLNVSFDNIYRHQPK